MSLAAQTASAFVRAALIAGAAVAWSARLGEMRGRMRWALLLAPFLTPPLLVSYAWSRCALALVAAPRGHQALYAALLFLKLVPVAVVIRWMMPPPFSAEARHCHRVLAATTVFGRAKFHLRGAGAGAWFAGGIVFLLAFADFEVASLWSIPTWTVALFDAQTGGMILRETLRLAALPVGVQMLVLALLLVVRAPPPAGMARAPGGKFAFAYLVLAALVVCAVPVIVVAVQAVAGLRVIAENFVIGNEIGASVLFALGAATVACGVIRVARSSRALAKASRLGELPCHIPIKTDDRTFRRRFLKVRPGGTPGPTFGTSVLPGIPGLAGSLIVSLMVLAIFQMPPLRPAYDTPLPLLLALTIILLPLALLLNALLRLRRRSPMRHIARQLGSRRLAWELDLQPRLAAFALLFCCAYFDFTASSILAPTGLTPVFVRLHNLAHYGQTAVLSAMMLAAFLAPAVLLGSAFIAGRIFARAARGRGRYGRE